MGKSQKIPYLNEAIIYFIKVALIFLVLSYLVAKTSIYNQSLILILSIFSAFSFNPLYLIMIIINYLISFGITTLNIRDLGFLFLYLFSVLIDTFLMILFLKIKYKLKEEE